MTGAITNSIKNTSQPLHCIPANIDRELWLKVLMSIKSTHGNSGYQLALDWSQTSPEQFNLNDFNSTWRSIKPSGGITIGTLLHIARQYGYNSNTKPTKLRPDEIERNRIVAENAEQDKRRIQFNAAKMAYDIWINAKPAINHPYLTTKKIKPHGTRIKGECLIVPIYDIDNHIMSIQSISGRGFKCFMNQARVRFGMFICDGDDSEVVLICEGFATGSTLNEATGYKVYCSFTAANLKHVAKAVCRKYPSNIVLICADNDYHLKTNVGTTKAIEAAQHAGCSVTLPPKYLLLNGPDYNDMADRHGLLTVSNSIKLALKYLNTEVVTYD